MSEVGQPVGNTRSDPEPAGGETRTVVWIEAMSEEEVSLLAEDLTYVLMRHPAGHQPALASDRP